MKEIIEDLKRENFTAQDWLLAAIGSIVFVLLTGIA